MLTAEWSSPNVIIQIAQLVIMFMGMLVLGGIQYALMRRNRESAERSNEYYSYMAVLDSILNFKTWASDNKTILNMLNIEEKVVKKLISENIVKNVNDLMDKCVFFYHLEKIFYLSKKAPTIMQRNSEGYINEIAIWLTIPGMDKFFNEFAKKYGTHSQEFINEIDQNLTRC